MYESPQPTLRFSMEQNRPRSLRTNFVSRPIPPPNIDRVNWTRTSIIIAIIFIVFCCLTDFQLSSQEIKQIPAQIQKPTHDSKQFSQVASETALTSLKIQQLIVSNPKISIDRQQNQRIQDQALKQFVIELEKNKKALTYKRQITQQELKQFKRQKLTIVKHQKLTSVSFEYSQMINSFFSIFWTQNQPFTGIDSILNEQNTNIWRSKGNLLTVVAENHFSPKAFTIVTNSAKKIFIFGLIIESVPFTANKQISKKSLGTFYLKQGENIIECNYLQCYHSYSMITFGMNQFEIKRLFVHSRERKLYSQNLEL